LELPVIVGIAGGTGSGKTTLARRVQEGLGSRSVSIQHDWYYRDQSEVPFDERAEVNFDHPNSLENDLLVRHLKALKAGDPIQAPQYDFTQHTRFDKTVEVEPLPV